MLSPPLLPLLALVLLPSLSSSSSSSSPSSSSPSSLSSSPSSPSSSSVCGSFARVVSSGEVKHCLCTLGTSCQGSHCTLAHTILNASPSPSSSQHALSGFSSAHCKDCECVPNRVASSPNAAPSSSTSTWVKKEARSTGARIAFVAGMEGTGHHLWASYVATAREKKPQLRSFTNNVSTDVKRALFNRDERGRLTGIFNAHTERFEDMASFEADMHVVHEALQGIAANSSESAPSLLWLNFGPETKETGFLSYPNFGGQDRALQVPDVALLARLAEGAGVDLRVVVLLRDPAESIASIERRFFSKARERLRNIRVFLAAISQLVVQLLSIDPAFIVCHDITAPPSIVDFPGIAKHLHPALGPDFVGILRGIDGPEPHAAESEREYGERHGHMEILLEEMRAYNALLHRICWGGE